MHGPLPDHGGKAGYSGLYRHGPEDATGIFDATTDALFDELAEKDAEAGELLIHQQRLDARRRIVDWLAMRPKMWPYVRLAMGYAQTPPARRDEIRGWLRAAKNLRAKLIDEANEYVRRRIAA